MATTEGGMVAADEEAAVVVNGVVPRLGVFQAEGTAMGCFDPAATTGICPPLAVLGCFFGVAALVGGAVTVTVPGCPSKMASTLFQTERTSSAAESPSKVHRAPSLPAELIGSDSHFADRDLACPDILWLLWVWFVKGCLRPGACFSNGVVDLLLKGRQITACPV